jgi:hypothetical protein
MQINTNDMTIVWNGGHTANVWKNGREIDVFTFSWEQNDPTAIDFVDAAIIHLSYMES